ncbi:protein bicaudal C homolog 1-like isoform X2 [Mya arenaria]|uniref:protein bicaudal C homolog 1-like isoform X2 n=1 Tax=Mya arenaria TaxID=6604 RepID=UPI0022DF5332|nr:protein bicaudal C homolog 1-like isoform X2 [Mya arenaria]
MADSSQSRRVEMRDSAVLSETGSDKGENTLQTKDNVLDNGYVEERFRVDRKKLEQMLQGNWERQDEAAEDFFQRIMDETNTQISWPSKLKIGAKSKKDPHIKVIGLPDDIRVAKDLIMSVLDTKSNRATLKMDVSYTDHSHVIGKGGNNIKRVMQETGCHVHFPDSNRGNHVQEKSNQVSIAGQPQGVEAARAKIRELLPLVFMFEIPVTPIPIQLPDLGSSTLQQFQQQYSVNISYRQRQRGYGTTVIVRGSVYNEKLVKEAALKMIEVTLGKLPTPLPVSMQLEIAPQHHLFIIGRGGMNIKQIMQVTGAVIHFPDPNTVAPQRKGLVYISGPIESVYQARQQLIGCLPLVLMFDVKEELEMDQGRIAQLMEHLDVFISVKPKPKQPSKSVIVKSIERNASNMYLARLLLLGIEKELPRQQANVTTQDGNIQNILSLNALGYFSQTIQPTLQISTANQQLLLLNTTAKSPPSTPHSQLVLVNGQKSPPSAQTPAQTHGAQVVLMNGQKTPPRATPSTLSPPSPQSPKAPSPTTHIINPPPGIYGPAVMVVPQVSAQSVADLMAQCSVSNVSSMAPCVPSPQEKRSPVPTYQTAGQNLTTRHDYVSRSQSEANSPCRSPCESPHPLRQNSSAVDLAGLSTSGSFVSHPKMPLEGSGSPMDLFGLTKPRPHGLSSSAHTHDLLGLSKTTDSPLGVDKLHYNMGGGGSLHGSLSHTSLHASLNSSLMHAAMNGESMRGSLHGSLNASSLHASLNNGSLHGSLNNGSLHGSLNLNNGGLHGSLNNGSMHGSLNNGSLHGNLNRNSLVNGMDGDLRAPGIERQVNQSGLYQDAFQTFGGDYEEKKLMANKAMQKKPIGEMSRIPTDYWSGLMFSKSMPTQAMREFAAMKQRYESPMATTYENPADEISELESHPWQTDRSSMYSRPVDPAPGEYPSPRKKWPEYGLSASNHIDGALVPSKSYWSPKLDLAELFIKLGLGKYTDLFQQQEIDLPTFLTLTDHDLRELGISTFGARKKMLLAIADLNKRRMLEESDPFSRTSPSHGSHQDMVSISGRW